MKMDFERFTRGIQRATVKDIEFARTRPSAQKKVADTYLALRKFMKLCDIDPDAGREAT